MSTFAASSLATPTFNVSTTAIITTATLTGNDPRFGGYTIGADGTAVQNFCPTSMVYTTQNTLAGCCSSINGTGACYLTQGCIGVSSIYGIGYTAVCNSGLVCNTDTVYDQYPTTSGSSRLAIYCGGQGATVKYYRQVVTATPTLVPVTYYAVPTTSSPTTGIIIISTGTSAATAPLSASSSSSLGSSSSDSQSGDGSKAWIAGAVVGPVVGLSLVALALWLVLRKRREPSPIEAKSYPMSEPDKGTSKTPTMMPM